MKKSFHHHKITEFYGADAEHLSGPQLKILESLAWWSHMGHSEPTRAQVAVKAGMKHTGGHFKTRLSELSTFGIVEYPTPQSAALQDWVR
jgi:hypothetical protein